MHAFNPLNKDEPGKLVDKTIYRVRIRSLLYLASGRLDIMHSVCLCATFQYDPRESHLKVVKRIVWYLVGTTNKCLFYKKNQDFRLVGYCDADYVGDKVERKSTSGGCHYIRPCLISWTGKKQNSITLSTSEAEYVFAVSCCSQLLWVKYQLEDYFSFEKQYTSILWQHYCNQPI